MQIAIPQTLIYRINAEGTITYVNPAWSEFARENQGEAALPEHILGSSLCAAISDSTVRELYKQMINRARAGRPVRFNFRCDSPDRRRFFEMEIGLLGSGEVQFTSTLTHEETRLPIVVLECGRLRNQAMLRVCSWCQKVAMPEGQWVPVEQAVAVLRLMEAEEFPMITHGICEPCQAEMMAMIGLE